MKISISRRIFRIFFCVNLLSLIIVAGAFWVALDSLKSTMLEIDKRAEIEHFVNMQTPDQLINIQSATLTILYIPDADTQKHFLPIMFEGLAVPYRGEVDLLGRRYSVAIQRIKHGTYYMAKDISLFQEREELFVMGMVVLITGIFLLSMMLAWIASRMISKPMQVLTEDIHQSSSNDTTTRLTHDYHDRELDEISSAINHYFDEIEGFVEREKTMMAMASHELRTPISVILGAAEVIVSRDQLAGNDKKTMARILASATNMAENIKSLLELVRKTREPRNNEAFRLDTLLTELYQEYILVNEGYQSRLELENSKANHFINSDPVLVKMLINNLINNAINHTKGRVKIVDHNDHLAIIDQGPWDTVKNPLQSPSESQLKSSTGLGLYIVSLICSHIGWRLEILRKAPSGTCVNLWFS